MRPAIRNLTVFGFILLLGTPAVATVLALLQKPSEASGPAKTMREALATIVVANFACIPFMAIGLVLLLVAWVKYRHTSIPMR
jgi:hypothetical protein